MQNQGHLKDLQSPSMTPDVMSRMSRIAVRQSKSADTRTAQHPVSKTELLDASKQHIVDVKHAMQWLSDKIMETGHRHDWTKINGIEQFHEDFTKVQTASGDKPDFTLMPWYQRHLKEERHHIDKKAPEDVDLIDVLEHVADIVMAGMARSGTVYPEVLPEELLKKAYQNTIRKMTDAVDVIG
jgi:hypothetical protein